MHQNGGKDIRTTVVLKLSCPSREWLKTDTFELFDSFIDCLVEFGCARKDATSVGQAPSSCLVPM